MANLKIMPYLRLFRIPALFTAMADIICGYLIANPEWGKGISSLFFLLISSGSLYTSGMVFNDYFDYEVDKVENPHRPLPAGDISRIQALVIGIIFLLAGVASAFYVGERSFYISILLVIAILLYNSGTKKFFILGPLNMGICRFLNMFLGMSTALQEVGWKIIFPALLMAYIAGVTILSRIESSGGKRGTVLMAFLPIGALIIIMGVFSIKGYFMSKAPAFFLVPFALLIALNFKKLYVHPDANNIKFSVKTMILSVILLDALFLSGFKGFNSGLLLVLLLVPSIILSRLIYIT